MWPFWRISAVHLRPQNEYQLKNKDVVICAMDRVMSAYDPKATPEYLQISSIKRTLVGNKML